MKNADAPFTDTQGMLSGDIINYDPSKEGTGEWKEGVIAKVFHFSLILKNGMAIGIARVHSHRHPAKTRQAPPPQAQVQEIPSPRKPQAEKQRPQHRNPKKYISFPF